MCAGQCGCCPRLLVVVMLSLMLAGISQIQMCQTPKGFWVVNALPPPRVGTLQGYDQVGCPWRLVGEMPQECSQNS